MCAAKHSKQAAAAAAHQLSLEDSSHASSSNGILGKRSSSDTTSIEKLRAETEDSHDDIDDSEGLDDVDKRERR